MIRRLFIHLGIQIGVLIAALFVSFFPAAIFMGTVGGTAIGVAPEPTFGLVEGFVCPEGTLEFFAVKRSYHRPGEFEPHVECISQDGTRENVLLPAIFSVLGGVFAVAFVGLTLLIYVPLATAAFLLTKRKQKHDN